MAKRRPLITFPATGLALIAGLAAGPQAATAQERVETSAGPMAVETVAGGLEHPWAGVFLPDGTMLVTERAGRLRAVSPDGQVSEPLSGVPEVFARGQGGLLDLALAPDFAENRLVYLTYAEQREDGAATTAARGRLNEDATALENVEVIFRQKPAVSGENHFGGRLAFAPDGNLFITLGERFDHMNQAQDPSNHLGAVVRITPDGGIPEDNPFAGKDGADEIWSYGHRNVEAAAVHPEAGTLWIAEMGPRGGDELNVPKAGENHGWPVVSWGQHYSGEQIPDPSSRPEFTDAVHHWTPVISPSGMTFYTGEAMPQWQGDILIGGLTAKAIVRVDLEGEDVAGEERIELGQRIRAAIQGPDGAVYALTDQADGEILRLSPAGQ